MHPCTHVIYTAALVQSSEVMHMLLIDTDLEEQSVLSQGV
jgi:hypothetical protein